MAEKKVEQGSQVQVHYTGTLPDGTVFDSSRNREPFTFEVGSGQVIDGFDKAVVGLAKGQKKKITLPPEEAYGAKDDKLVVTVPENIFGEKVPDEGDRVALRGQDGQTYEGTVHGANDEGVVVDLNHPLAGETLNFEIEVLEIQ